MAQPDLFFHTPIFDGMVLGMPDDAHECQRLYANIAGELRQMGCEVAPDTRWAVTRSVPERAGGSDVVVGVVVESTPVSLLTLRQRFQAALTGLTPRPHSVAYTELLGGRRAEVSKP